VGGSEREGAESWLRRVGWKRSEVAKQIAEENDPEETGFVADIGGGHGREALWLDGKHFQSILIDPNRYSLEYAKERVKNKKLSVHLINAVLPYLPMRSGIIGVVDLYWTLHQIRDEDKLNSLKEIHRILRSKGSLYSTSFGHWVDHTMPSSIFPIAEKQTFLKLHVSADFRPYRKIEERSDRTMPFEKYWYGKFQKEH